jgi:fructokinase
MSRQRPCIFGEVLFDHFPDGKRVLGGAPFNVAWHLQAFGQSPYFVSRVCDDAEGEEIRAAMRGWGMDSSGLQTDSERPTGKVMVSFENAEPAYDIVENCAYDAIDSGAIEASPAARDCEFLYHGSLALRGEPSRSALWQLETTGRKTVFIDVNLRSPWWQLEQVQEMLRGASWVKLNRDELDLLGRDGSGSVLEPPFFLREYALRGLLLTLGASGAALHTRDGDPVEVSPRGEIDLVDTVGAGDAFASVTILGLLNQWPAQLTLRRAQDFASCIVGRQGATVADPSFYRPFIEEWKLAR